jgi:hypothetical protein
MVQSRGQAGSAVNPNPTLAQGLDLDEGALAPGQLVEVLRALGAARHRPARLPALEGLAAGAAGLAGWPPADAVALLRALAALGCRGDPLLARTRDAAFGRAGARRAARPALRATPPAPGRTAGRARRCRPPCSPPRA